MILSLIFSQVSTFLQSVDYGALTKYQLASAELSRKNEAEAKKSLDAVLKSIDYESIKSEQETMFRDALIQKNYARILRVFNEKGLVTSVGHFLGLVDKDYCNRVLSLLKGKLHDDIINIIAGYLPTEIPR